MEEQEEDNKLKINTANLSFDKSIIVIGTNKGFLVCKTNPFKVIREKLIKGGIKIGLIIERSNLFFLLGMATLKENQDYNENLIVLYDDKKERKITEIKMSSPVLNLKLNSKHLFVVTYDRIFIFHTKKLKNIGKFDCFPSNNGTAAINCSVSQSTFACLDKSKPGNFNVFTYLEENVVSMENMFAHSSIISKMALNNEGSKILTTSDNGTLIRLFDIKSKTMLEEFRRGTDKAEMFCLCFSLSENFFSCCCDTGDMHVFKRNPDKKTIEMKPKGFLSKLSGIFKNKEKPESSRSFAILRTNEVKGYSLFFINDNELGMIAGKSEFKFYKFSFDSEKGGEIKNIIVTEIISDDNAIMDEKNDKENIKN